MTEIRTHAFNGSWQTVWRELDTNLPRAGGTNNSLLHHQEDASCTCHVTRCRCCWRVRNVCFHRIYLHHARCQTAWRGLGKKGFQCILAAENSDERPSGKQKQWGFSLDWTKCIVKKVRHEVWYWKRSYFANFQVHTFILGPKRRSLHTFIFTHTWIKETFF